MEPALGIWELYSLFMVLDETFVELLVVIGCGHFNTAFLLRLQPYNKQRILWGLKYINRTVGVLEPGVACSKVELPCEKACVFSIHMETIVTQVQKGDRACHLRRLPLLKSLRPIAAKPLCCLLRPALNSY